MELVHKPVSIVAARNRYYVLWPFDHEFMKVFKTDIPSSARHFYGDSKWWHIDLDWWERAFGLFQHRYYPDDITFSEADEPPCEDEDYPLVEPDPEELADEEIDLNTGTVHWPPPPAVSLDSMTLAQALSILHLIPTASFADAKVMYRKLSHECHPDHGGMGNDQIKLNRAFDLVRGVLDVS